MVTVPAVPQPTEEARAQAAAAVGHARAVYWSNGGFDPIPETSYRLRTMLIDRPEWDPSDFEKLRTLQYPALVPGSVYEEPLKTYDIATISAPVPGPEAMSHRSTDSDIDRSDSESWHTFEEELD